MSKEISNTKSSIIVIHSDDNVGIIVHEGGLNKGHSINEDITLNEHVPFGHKVALCPIPFGEHIIRYGQVIGRANTDISKGDWVSERNMSMPDAPNLSAITINPTSSKTVDNHVLKEYTFLGYKNLDGSVGTKNILGISTSVQCVAGLTQHVAKKIKEELLPLYENVDDVVPLNHSYGCGVAINAPGASIPIRTIQNIAQNPNFGGRILVIGLGCEKLRPERITEATSKNNSSIMYMQDESFNGFHDMVEGALEMAKTHLEELNKRKREECPISDLVVGMQCGGSDAFSGITANPVAGYAADLLVQAGASVMFSEITEIRDAAHLLIPRAINNEVGQALIDEMKWYDDYLLKDHADRSANTTPGNKRGGLSNIVEKALGSIAKSGTSPIVDVLSPGEKIRRKGLIFAATPASDFVCGTLQLASGMNMHVFMTGRGTPYGLSMVPVIKVGSNSKLSKRWFDLIDLDAGKIATGERTIEEMGWELFHLMIDVASGKKKVACDLLGLHNDMVLFNPGPLT